MKVFFSVGDVSCFNCFRFLISIFVCDIIADTKRVWMLLQFMENLEKALYNAYEGTAGQITTHGKVCTRSPLLL